MVNLFRRTHILVDFIRYPMEVHIKLVHLRKHNMQLPEPRYRECSEYGLFIAYPFPTPHKAGTQGPGLRRERWITEGGGVGRVAGDVCVPEEVAM